MNFLGCTFAMKANAEKYVKANYVANWAPEQHVASVVLALIQPKKQLLTTWLVAFKSLVETQLDGEESETEQSILPSPQSEVYKYLTLPQLPLQRNGKDTTPLDWWKIHSNQFPHLARITMHASSAGPERLFSATGKMHDGQNKNTKEDTLSLQLEVKMNQYKQEVNIKDTDVTIKGNVTIQN